MVDTGNITKTMIIEWYSIENMKKWHEMVCAKIKQYKLGHRVRAFFFEFIPFWLKPGWKWEESNPHKYVDSGSYIAEAVKSALSYGSGEMKNMLILEGYYG
ncbi:MAG: hypothetical protein WC645_03570 [Candidatus Margulisiibacteriota bacterium]